MLKTFARIRSDFHFGLDQDNGFGRKVMTAMLLAYIVLLGYTNYLLIVGA
jgi:hypothetical protein